MSKLFVVGNVYSDSSENAEELFGVLTEAGYTLGYNTMSSTSAVIMKEVAEESAEEQQ